MWHVWKHFRWPHSDADDRYTKSQMHTMQKRRVESRAPVLKPLSRRRKCKWRQWSLSCARHVVGRLLCPPGGAVTGRRFNSLTCTTSESARLRALLSNCSPTVVVCEMEHDCMAYMYVVEHVPAVHSRSMEARRVCWPLTIILLARADERLDTCRNTRLCCSRPAPAGPDLLGRLELLPSGWLCGETPCHGRRLFSMVKHESDR